jgi:hypothetical protein
MRFYVPDVEKRDHPYFMRGLGVRPPANEGREIEDDYFCREYCGTLGSQVARGPFMPLMEYDESQVKKNGAMLSVLRHQNRLYQDQLYNPRAGDAGMWEFYRRVISDHWRVYHSVENDPVSKIHCFAAFTRLAAAHRLPYT